MARTHHHISLRRATSRSPTSGPVILKNVLQSVVWFSLLCSRGLGWPDYSANECHQNRTRLIHTRPSCTSSGPLYIRKRMRTLKYMHQKRLCVHEYMRIPIRTRSTGGRWRAWRAVGRAYVRIRICTCECICLYMCLWLRVVHTCMYIYIYKCDRVCSCMRIRIPSLLPPSVAGAPGACSIVVHTYACLHVHIYIYIYMHMCESVYAY